MYCATACAPAAASAACFASWSCQSSGRGGTGIERSFAIARFLFGGGQGQAHEVAASDAGNGGAFVPALAHCFLRDPILQQIKLAGRNNMSLELSQVLDD